MLITGSVGNQLFTWCYYLFINKGHGALTLETPGFLTVKNSNKGLKTMVLTYVL